MKKYLVTVIICVFFLNPVSFAQWGAGLSLNLKNELPKKGIGFIVTHNLPFQWPLIGFAIRFEADYFKERSPNIIERDVHLSIAGTVYFKDMQPYFTVGAGYAFHTANDADNNSFLFQEIAGVQFAGIAPVYPFAEIKFLQYLSELRQGSSEAKRIQIAGAIGVRFEF